MGVSAKISARELPAGSRVNISSSMAAASNRIDHVRTQIPYALIGAAGAIAIYLLVA